MKYKYTETFSKAVSVEMVVKRDELVRMLWNKTLSDEVNEAKIAEYLSHKNAVEFSDMSFLEFQKMCETLPEMRLADLTQQLTEVNSPEEELEFLSKFLVYISQRVTKCGASLSEIGENNFQRVSTK